MRVRNPFLPQFFGRLQVRAGRSTRTERTSRDTTYLFQLRDGRIAELFERSEPVRRMLMRTDWGIVHQNPRDGLRTAEDGAKTLKNASDDQILEAMVADPILIERPLVETDKGVRLGRPPEKVREIL